MFADPTDRADGTPAVGGRRPSRRARHAAADTEPGPWAPPVAAPHRPGDAAVVPAEAEVAVSPAAADPAAADQVDAVAGPAGGDTTAAGQPCTGDVSPPTRPYAGDFREARAARRYRGDAAGRADWPARDRVARDPAGAWAPDDTAGWPVSGRPVAWDTRARPSDRLPAAPPAGRSAADPAVRQPRPTQERTWAAPARDHQPGRGGGRVEADPLLDWLPPEAAASRPAHGGAPTGPEPPVTPEPPTAPPPACPSPAPPPAACDRLVADHAPGGGNADSHAATPHTTDPHTTNSHTTDPHTAGAGTVDLDVVGPGTVGGDTSGAGAAAAAGERPVP
ncbi:MAG TPA: hypothetical protein VFY17_00295, partial [Pilimelia sp.]|nr:hypothetical protein [Pilimelia sp.]